MRTIPGMTINIIAALQRSLNRILMALCEHPYRLFFAPIVPPVVGTALSAAAGARAPGSKPASQPSRGLSLPLVLSSNGSKIVRYRDFDNTSDP